MQQSLQVFSAPVDIVASREFRYLDLSDDLASACTAGRTVLLPCAGTGAAASGAAATG